MMKKICCYLNYCFFLLSLWKWSACLQQTHDSLSICSRRSAEETHQKMCSTLRSASPRLWPWCLSEQKKTQRRRCLRWSHIYALLWPVVQNIYSNAFFHQISCVNICMIIKRFNNWDINGTKFKNIWWTKWNNEFLNWAMVNRSQYVVCPPAALQCISS